MMERIEKSLDTATLLEEYRVLLQTVDALPLAVTGSSMAPFLVSGRDSVLLTRPPETLRRGDIALYRRESGAYVLHRVHHRERDGSYAMLGDAQQTIEHGVRRAQIIAVVQSAKRKGKRQQKGCFWWEFFAHVWPRLVALRPALLRLYQSIQTALGRKS